MNSETPWSGGRTNAVAEPARTRRRATCLGLLLGAVATAALAAIAVFAYLRHATHRDILQSGGVLEGPGGIRITVPPGTLDAGGELTVKAVKADGGGQSPVWGQVEIAAPTSVLQRSLLIQMPTSGATNVRVMSLRFDRWIEVSSALDSTGQHVEFETRHLCLFGLARAVEDQIPSDFAVAYKQVARNLFGPETDPSLGEAKALSSPVAKLELANYGDAKPAIARSAKPLTTLKVGDSTIGLVRTSVATRGGHRYVLVGEDTQGAIVRDPKIMFRALLANDATRRLSRMDRGRVAEVFRRSATAMRKAARYHLVANAIAVSQKVLAEALASYTTKTKPTVSVADARDPLLRLLAFLELQRTATLLDEAAAGLDAFEKHKNHVGEVVYLYLVVVDAAKRADAVRALAEQTFPKAIETTLKNIGSAFSSALMASASSKNAKAMARATTTELARHAAADSVTLSWTRDAVAVASIVEALESTHALSAYAQATSDEWDSLDVGVLWAQAVVACTAEFGETAPAGDCWTPSQRAAEEKKLSDNGQFPLVELSSAEAKERGLDDVNGDGVADVVVRATGLSGSGGDSYVLYERSAAGCVRPLGTFDEASGLSTTTNGYVDIATQHCFGAMRCLRQTFVYQGHEYTEKSCRVCNSLEETCEPCAEGDGGENVTGTAISAREAPTGRIGTKVSERVSEALQRSMGRIRETAKPYDLSSDEVLGAWRKCREQTGRSDVYSMTLGGTGVGVEVRILELTGTRWIAIRYGFADVVTDAYKENAGRLEEYCVGLAPWSEASCINSDQGTHECPRFEQDRAMLPESVRDLLCGASRQTHGR